MKKIYKLGFIAFMSLIGLSASAQDSPLTWGVKAGVNLSNVSIKDYDGDIKAKVGFQVGVTADYAITDAFYLQSGLSFTTKGAKEEYKYETSAVKANAKGTINQMYLQLPIMAAYKLEIAPETKIVFNAGPYLAYGIGGKTKTEYTITAGGSSATLSDTKTDTFGDDGLKRFDFGLGAGVGVELGQIVVGLNYELGLTNIARAGDLKNRNAALTVGYRF